MGSNGSWLLICAVNNCRKSSISMYEPSLLGELIASDLGLVGRLVEIESIIVSNF